MGEWRNWTRCIGATLVMAGVVAPLAAGGPSAGAAVGPSATTTTVVPYSCAGVGFAAYLGTLPTQNVTVTLTAPTEVTVGQAFVVTATVTPLTLAEPPLALNVQAVMPLNPGGATGTAGGSGVSGQVSSSGAVFTVPQFSMTATPTAAAGGTATFAAGNIAIVQGSTGFACSKLSGATAMISTKIVAALTTSSTTPPSTTTSTTTIPGQTTTTADPNQPTSTTTTSTTSTTTSTTSTSTTSTTTAPTTVPPTVATTTAAPPTVPPTPSGTVASIITPSASASFTCNIYDDGGTKFNQNPLPTSNVTVVITIPNKVGVGGKISGQVKMDPGPLNGPIALKAGTVNFTVDLTVSGASPSTVTAKGGPNGSQIAPNVAAVSPNMGFDVTTTAPAGGEVSIGVKQVEVIATSPTKLTTRCTPGGSAMAKVAGVSVVADAVVAPASLSRSTSGSGSRTTSGGASSGTSGGTSSDGGYANCAAAKADGRGTIVKTDSAYRTRLDGDGDGLACEADDPSVLGTSLARSGTTTFPLVTFSVGAVTAGLALLLASRRRSAVTAGA